MARADWACRPAPLQLIPDEEGSSPTHRRSIERLAFSGLCVSAAVLVFLVSSTSSPLHPLLAAHLSAGNVELAASVPGYTSENSCPYGTVALTEEECKDLPNRIGGALHDPFMISSADDPQGCFGFRDWVYYNLHPVGRGRAERKLYCKRDKGPTKFQKISDGVCTDYGFLPISEPSQCEQAAREMRLTDVYVHFTKEEARPEGCYFFANVTDSTGTLWINTDPDSRGNGAEKSEDFAWTRQPLCVAQTTPEPLPMSSIVTTTQDLSRNYISGPAGSIGCQKGTVPLVELECQKMPFYFEGTLHQPFVVHSLKDPQGCFVDGNGSFAYNIHTAGAPNPKSKVYCRISESGSALRGRGTLDQGCGNACRLIG